MSTELPPPPTLGDQPWRVEVRVEPEFLPDLRFDGTEGPFAAGCSALGLSDLRRVGEWIRGLPYGRSFGGRDSRWLLVEGRSTCTSGSGLVHGLARELGRHLPLVWLVFTLDGRTHPQVEPVLRAHGTDGVLEVHTVLSCDGAILDLAAPAPMELPVWAQTETHLAALGARKVAWHRALLGDGADGHRRWRAREACIRALTPPGAGVRAVPVEAVRALRHEVLRPGRPPSSARFEGDHEPGTLHVAWQAEDGTVLAVGSSIVRPRPDGPPGGRQIRGMAVEVEHRGRGLGRAICRALVAHAAAFGAPEVWCNARASAVGLYTRLGFEPLGGPFELPPIGPHQRLHLPLPRAP